MTDTVKHVLTNCDSCGIEIRAIVPIEHKYDVYWCDKIKCKLLLTIKNNIDWRKYIPPNQWEEAKKIISEIEGEKFK